MIAQFPLSLNFSMVTLQKVLASAPTVILSDSTTRRIDSTLNFTLGSSFPMTGVNTNAFMVVWSGILKPQSTGLYNFYFTGQEGFQVYLAGVLVASSWVVESDATTIEVLNIVLDSSLNYEFQVEMFAQEGEAVMIAE